MEQIHKRRNTNGNIPMKRCSTSVKKKKKSKEIPEMPIQAVVISHFIHQIATDLERITTPILVWVSEERDLVWLFKRAVWWTELKLKRAWSLTLNFQLLGIYPKEMPKQDSKLPHQTAYPHEIISPIKPGSIPILFSNVHKQSYSSVWHTQ